MLAQQLPSSGCEPGSMAPRCAARASLRGMTQADLARGLGVAGPERISCLGARDE